MVKALGHTGNLITSTTGKIGTGLESLARDQDLTGSVTTDTMTMEQPEMRTGDQETLEEQGEVVSLDKIVKSMCG